MIYTLEEEFSIASPFDLTNFVTYNSMIFIDFWFVLYGWLCHFCCCCCHCLIEGNLHILCDYFYFIFMICLEGSCIWWVWRPIAPDFYVIIWIIILSCLIIAFDLSGSGVTYAPVKWYFSNIGFPFYCAIWRQIFICEKLWREVSVDCSISWCGLKWSLMLMTGYIPWIINYTSIYV